MQNPQFQDTKESYWQAVLMRDKSKDTDFVYAVRSTGIYCRPSCPARKPKVENTEFFSLARLAEKAGYRACKRCNPAREQSYGKQSYDARLQRMHEICQYITKHSEQELSLEHLATRFSLSPSHLQRSFKKIIGVSPQVYLETVRISAIKTALQKGQDISTALYDAGYSSSSRLYSKAKAQLGMTPRTYKYKGASMDIFYTISTSPLGKLLVAASEKGICSVRLGDDAKQLKQELFTEFGNAELIEDVSKLSGWVESIIKHLEGKEPHLDLPLDIRATAFQKQVWQALQDIPYGETRSYAKVAESLGKATAVRAVASACAKNPVALLVPCHRVIRSDGSMGGYRWGLERKKRLLSQEASKITADCYSQNRTYSNSQNE